MSNITVHQDADTGIATITLNRPDRRNALSLELMRELIVELEDLRPRQKQIRAVILAANGKVFCSGHDLSQMTGRTVNDYRQIFDVCTVLMQTIHSIPQPVIARVHGVATAAGCQLVAACDLAVAAIEARFATPGVKIGLFCSTPMVPLVRAVSPKVAMEMLLTGQPISAERAMTVGLINRVVAADQLDAAVREFTNAIIASSPMTIRLGKRAFYDQLNLDESVAYDRATRVMTENAVKQDAQEGISAFLQKRQAQWTGE